MENYYVTLKDTVFICPWVFLSAITILYTSVTARAKLSRYSTWNEDLLNENFCQPTRPASTRSFHCSADFNISKQEYQTTVKLRIIEFINKGMTDTCNINILWFTWTPYWLWIKEIRLGFKPTPVKLSLRCPFRFNICSWVRCYFGNRDSTYTPCTSFLVYSNLKFDIQFSL